MQNDAASTAAAFVADTDLRWCTAYNQYGAYIVSDDHKSTPDSINESIIKKLVLDPIAFDSIPVTFGDKIMPAKMFIAIKYAPNGF